MKRTILCDAKNCKDNDQYGKCQIRFYQFKLDSEGKCRSFKDKDEYEAELKAIDEFWENYRKKIREKQDKTEYKEEEIDGEEEMKKLKQMLDV